MKADMVLNIKQYIEGLNIKECSDCEEIRLLQAANNKNIKVAPLFWQGEGRVNIPLIIFGINPSVVGTLNEPQRGCDFDRYYDYYQNRGVSEKESVLEAKEEHLAIPVKYWTICQNLATKVLGYKTPRWQDYILMEAIHCFYNKSSDLPLNMSKVVADKCFSKHAGNILAILKPKMMVLLGNQPYEVLKKYLEHGLSNYEYCALNIDGLRIPVLRHPHPTGYNPRGLYRPDCYLSFKEYCASFYGTS